MNNILNKNEQLPEWLTYGRMVLCQKEQTEGNTVDNYHPISCLPLMWNLLAGILTAGEDIIVKKIVKGIAEEPNISYYWTKQSSETAKGKVQTLQWLG